MVWNFHSTEMGLLIVPTPIGKGKAAAAAFRVWKLVRLQSAFCGRFQSRRSSSFKLCLCRAATFPGIVNKGVSFAQVGMDSEVLFTSMGASASLFSACALVAWMQKSGLLPPETPAVLSQVAFRIMIPCYLMSKVARVLATHATSNVAAVPVLAVAQIIIGAMIGRLACVLLYGRSTLPLKILAKKKAVVTTACAFGNTLSLPLVFLNGILPLKDANLAAGYLALFMAGWSPILWTFAYQILRNAGASHSNEKEGKKLELIEVLQKWYKRIFNPPLYGVLSGIVLGLSPASRFFFPQQPSASPLLSRILAPVYDAGAFLGSAAPALQVTVLACSLAGVMKTRSAKLPHFWGPRRTKAVAKKSGLAVIDATAETTLIDGKETLVILCVRVLLVPLVFCITLSLAERLQLVTLDRICKLTLLVLSAMPSAQNLVVLTQLRSSTRPLAKELASLLLLQYLGALVPITLWLALFLGMVN